VLLKVGAHGEIEMDSIVAEEVNNPNLMINVAWMGLARRSQPVHYVFKGKLLNAGREPITAGYRSESSALDTLVDFSTALDPMMIVAFNTAYNGDTLREMRELQLRGGARAQKLMSLMLKIGEDNIGQAAWDAAFQMLTGSNPIFMKLNEPRVAGALVSALNSVVVRRLGEIGGYLSGRSDSRVTMEDFAGFTPPPESIVESVEVLGGNRVRMILRGFHRPRFIRWQDVVYRIARPDLKSSIGFRAMDMTFNGGTFPSVTAYSSESCNSFASHPNIGTGGTVCLGDLPHERDVIPTLKDFMLMMSMMNFDSAYWGRLQVERVFDNVDPGVPWENQPGLYPINTQGGW
jgi:hypothetical protein